MTFGSSYRGFQKLESSRNRYSTVLDLNFITNSGNIVTSMWHSNRVLTSLEHAFL